MKPKRLHIPLLIAVAVSLLLIVLHGVIPDKRRTIISSNGEELYSIYLDGPVGEGSIEWVDKAKNHFRCVVAEGQEQYCGFSMYFGTVDQGIDLSGYENIRLKVHYNGSPVRAKIFMRNFVRGYSTPDDGNSGQFILLFLWTRHFDEELTISLNELKVADWWINEYSNFPRELSRAGFSNVTAFGIDVVEHLNPGVYDFIVEEIEFYGERISAEHWYLGILGLWLVGTLIYIVNRLLYLHRRTRIDLHRIQQLSSDNLQLRSESDKYKTLSTRDPLTGTLNRYGLDLALKELMRSESIRNIALILLDIDDFKRINDLFGHETGDKALIHIADILISNTRNIDSVSRWGGEEFLLLCPHTDEDSAYLLADKMRKIIETKRLSGTEDLVITASFAVGVLYKDESFKSAFNRIDEALLKAKNSGKNRVMFA